MNGPVIRSFNNTFVASLMLLFCVLTLNKQLMSGNGNSVFGFSSGYDRSDNTYTLPANLTLFFRVLPISITY